MRWFTDHGVELKVDITVVTEDALLCSKLLTMFLPSLVYCHARPKMMVESFLSLTIQLQW
jgi:hypothetical protein